jgi:hypothetical protein
MESTPSAFFSLTAEGPRTAGGEASIRTSPSTNPGNSIDALWESGSTHVEVTTVALRGNDHYLLRRFDMGDEIEYLEAGPVDGDSRGVFGAKYDPEQLQEAFDDLGRRWFVSLGFICDVTNGSFRPGRSPTRSIWEVWPRSCTPICSSSTIGRSTTEASTTAVVSCWVGVWAGQGPLP